jgi:hypothetical protein
MIVGLPHPRRRADCSLAKRFAIIRRLFPASILTLPDASHSFINSILSSYLRTLAVPTVANLTHIFNTVSSLWTLALLRLNRILYFQQLMDSWALLKNDISLTFMQLWTLGPKRWGLHSAHNRRRRSDEEAGSERPVRRSVRGYLLAALYYPAARRA